MKIKVVEGARYEPKYKPIPNWKGNFLVRSVGSIEELTDIIGSKEITQSTVKDTSLSHKGQEYYAFSQDPTHHLGTPNSRWSYGFIIDPNAMEQKGIQFDDYYDSIVRNALEQAKVKWENRLLIKKCSVYLDTSTNQKLYKLYFNWSNRYVSKSIYDDFIQAMKKFDSEATIELIKKLNGVEQSNPRGTKLVKQTIKDDMTEFDDSIAFNEEDNGSRNVSINDNQRNNKLIDGYVVQKEGVVYKHPNDSGYAGMPVAFLNINESTRNEIIRLFDEKEVRPNDNTFGDESTVGSGPNYNSQRTKDKTTRDYYDYKLRYNQQPLRQLNITKALVGIILPEQDYYIIAKDYHVLPFEECVKNIEDAYGPQTDVKSIKAKKNKEIQAATNSKISGLKNLAYALNRLKPGFLIEPLNAQFDLKQRDIKSLVHEAIETEDYWL